MRYRASSKLIAHSIDNTLNPITDNASAGLISSAIDHCFHVDSYGWRPPRPPANGVLQYIHSVLVNLSLYKSGLGLQRNVVP